MSRSTGTEIKVNAGGSRYHAPAGFADEAAGLYKTVCGKTGYEQKWPEGKPNPLRPCKKCYSH